MVRNSPSWFYSNVDFWLSPTKDSKLGSHCLPAKHDANRSNEHFFKIYYFYRINNQPLVVLRRKERFCGNQKTHENEALHQNTHGTAGFARCAYPYSMAVIVNDTEESYKENDDDYDNTLHHSAADYQGHVKNNTLAGNHQSNSFTTDCEENPYDT